MKLQTCSLYYQMTCCSLQCPAAGRGFPSWRNYWSWLERGLEGEVLWTVNVGIGVVEGLSVEGEEEVFARESSRED